ncbi:uncharacterized protein DUF1302 [Panacagrimonas perspica]|uniref:Uncharacterized protein DUF1302 n=2 Tax=Panacagrimonas perspica TaxID=381431 RepID=A0A4R7P606_9GAMM|nr:DUF1302 family protein [Panacagrimonas perspica]TDU28460.1 uncharacterized protein DUF1302 [Panacagrimonas perspica]
MKRAGFAALAVLTLSTLATPVAAYEKEFDGGLFDGWLMQWRNRASLGMAWRMQERQDRLIGKASLNPQLCAPDNCIALTPDNTEPNERFLAARGAMSSNTDDGDLNYNKGDLISSGTKYSSKLDFGTTDYGVEIGALFYYDPVNTDFRETHFNRIVEPGPGPGVRTKTDRPTEAEHQLGFDLELREANFYYFMDSWDEQPLEFRVGRQILTWGEAAVNVQGTLNFVNPPDANSLARPGLELQDIYFPENMIVVRGPVRGTLSFEAFYQLEWRPYGFPARGSFFSFFDGGNEVTPNEYVVGPFGKTPEDPLQLGVPALPLAQTVTSTSFSLRREANNEPGDHGQYGIALYWLLDEYFESPVSINFFHANYHSRLPAVSAYAANAACTRREGNARNHDSTNLVDFLLDCGVPGTNNSPNGGFDALPLDTGTYFLDYAKNIRLWGLSFDAEAHKLAIQGELVYRENQPVQVDLEDVLFTAFQPIFPRTDVVIAPGVATLAASTRAIPTYLTAYRGGTPGEVAPNSYVRGYERFKTIHGTIGFTKITGASSWFGANEAVYLLEISGNFIPQLPDLDELQLEGPGTHTHYSPGIADTGDALKINPISNGKKGYVTETAFGYRFASFLRYTDVVIPGFALRPLVIFAHDVHGVAPGLAENFLEGRKVIIGNLQGQYRNWRADLIYSWFTGGGDAHVLRDRDAMGISISYEF